MIIPLILPSSLTNGFISLLGSNYRIAYGFSNRGKNKDELSISQRQAIIKLKERQIETKDTWKIGKPFLH